jgi:hypothetical protein
VPTLTPEAPVARALPPQPEKPAPLPAEPATPDDSPWFLDKSSWRFHRRFYAVFRRPMQRGEYSHLLRQGSIRPRRAPRRELLARHTARPPHYATGPCKQVDVAHHPAEGLATAGIGRIGGCRRRGRKSVPSRAPSTLRTDSSCPA